MSALDGYAHKDLGDGLFWIQERYYESDNRANIWLQLGSQQDLLVDAGLGLRSLPEYLRAAGLRGEGADSRPLLALATHVHFDHSGGLHQFPRVAVHRAEAEALRRGDNYEAVTWLRAGEVRPPPSPEWRRREYGVRGVEPSLELEEGDVINLGDRQLMVMHMPGHSRGSICLHDNDRKMLFTGDTLYDGELIDWLPYSKISDYVGSCERLIELADKGLVEKVFPGHYSTFGAERMYWLASNYINTVGLCHKVSTFAIKSLATIVLHTTNSRTTPS